MVKEIGIDQSTVYLNDKKLKQNQYRISFVKQNQQQEILQKNQNELYQYFANSTGTINYQEQKQEITEQYDKAVSNLDKAQKLLEEYQTSVEEQNQYAEKYQQYSQTKNLLQQVEQCLDQILNQESQIQINSLEEEKIKIDRQLKHNQNIIDKNKNMQMEYQLEMQEFQKQQEDEQIKIEIINNYEQQLQQYDESIINKISQQNGKQFNYQDNNQQQKIIQLQTQLQNKQKIINSLTQIQQMEHGKATASLRELKQNTDLKIKDFQIQQQQIETQLQKIINQKQQYIQLLQSQDQSNLMQMRSKVQQTSFKVDYTQRQITSMKDKQNQIIMQILQGNQQKYLVYQFLQQFKNNGLLGLFGELISVSPELITVVETACQGLLQYYVIDTYENAMKIISQLQLNSQQNQQLQGCKINFITCDEFNQQKEIQKTASFVSQISSQESKENILIMSEQIKPLDDRIKGIIHNYFNRTLIVQSFVIAQQFSKQFKCDCYTIDGDCVRQSGLINAGYHQQQSGQLLKQIEQLQEQLKKYKEQEQIYEQQLQQIQKEFYDIQNSNTELQQKIDIQIKEEEKQQDKLAEINATISDLQEQQNLLVDLLNKNQKIQIDDLQQDVNELQTQLALTQQQYDIDQQQINNIDQQTAYMIYLLLNEIKQNYNIKDNYIQNLQLTLQQHIQNNQQIQQQIQQQKTKIDLLDAEINQLQQDQENNIQKKNQIQDQEQILKEQIEYINNKDKIQITAEHIISANNNKSGLILIKQKYIKELQDLENQVNILQFQTYQQNYQLLQQQQEEFNKYIEEKNKIYQKLITLDQIRQSETEKNFKKFVQEFNTIYNYFQTGFQLQIQLQQDKMIFIPSTQQLSGGQQTVVSLSFLMAQSLISDNQILLLDELDSNLDTMFRDRFYSLLKQLVEQRHIQIIMTSFKEQSLDIANNILLVQNATILPVQDKNQINYDILVK